jgi:hypothetical protein
VVVVALINNFTLTFRPISCYSSSLMMYRQDLWMSSLLFSLVISRVFQLSSLTFFKVFQKRCRRQCRCVVRDTSSNSSIMIGMSVSGRILFLENFTDLRDFNDKNPNTSNVVVRTFRFVNHFYPQTRI